MTSALELRRGMYRDSVRLMQVSRSVGALDGVARALVSMATELNLELLAGMGFDVPEDAGANDLVIAIRAHDDDALRRAREHVEQELAAPSGGSSRGGGTALGPTFRTVGAAGQDATVALLSIPGPHVFAEAVDALDSGLHVMVFSDNVPVEHEIRLKDYGRERGLLVMGPDCGTAVVGGVGLGFANVVRSGPVGIVAASGTGSQQLMCLLHSAGAGISHCLGVGGRDLSEAVGARSTLQAMAMLDADPATGLIVVVSKPPAPSVAAEVARYAAELATPVQLAFLGRGQDDLTTATEKALTLLGLNGGDSGPTVWPAWLPECPLTRRGGVLRGLFCGGTLCDEAMAIAAESLGPIASNIPLEPGWALPANLHSEGHLMIDFGDDGLTAGRPHPMIDPSPRLERLAAELARPRTAAVLLDVVLGHGAHADPAAPVAEAIRTAGPGAPPVVVSLCGTDADPQGLYAQARVLAEAGAEVHLSNAAATRRAVALVERQPS
ncbi:FdrA family protein [Streptomyces sp. NPDC020801]|uniref:FdrA family protein n=1 Tax=Streptomyces sp. NPDC020801 TaxID=3365093 RepID=UPI00379665EB